MGIPVSQISTDKPDSVLIELGEKLASKRKAEDLLSYADAFTCAKWLLKAIAFETNHDVSFIPMDNSGKSNSLELVAPELIKQNISYESILASRL
jgi:hypothetical protein